MQSELAEGAPPHRPSGVPAAAKWSDSIGAWELVEFDANARRCGTYRSYRVDGSLKFECRYENGLRHGPFRAYHPNGERSREGEFIGDAPHGLVVAYRSDAIGSEPLRACCVPTRAREMRAEYNHGELLLERFFDGDGRLLLSDGNVAPQRPSGVPERALYDESSDRWYTREADGELELVRIFDASGLLTQDDLYLNCRRTRTRRFFGDGTCKAEEHFDDSGQLTGKRTLRYGDGEPSPFANPEIVEECAMFEAGEPVGVTDYFSAAGSVRRSNRGAAFEPADLASPVFGAAELTAAAWSELCDELTRDGRVRLAFCAAARAAARGRSKTPLANWLEENVVELRGDVANELAEALSRGESSDVSRVLSAVLLGAEPSLSLCTLAKCLPGTGQVALDFVEAAILLAPDNDAAYGMRAMTRLELGLVDQALADAERAAKFSPALTTFVREYARLLFPTWRFFPRETGIDSPALEGLSEAPRQPLESVRRTITLYATRLQRLRAAAKARLAEGEPDWLPPELTSLMPTGPLELTRATATIVDQTEDGEEASEVIVDETLPIEGASLQTLQLLARADWAALTWLCWVSGLDHVAMPDTFSPRANFAAAASQAIVRAGRIADVVATGGLRARMQGAPSFEWEGFDVDGLPASFARIAMTELVQVRAMFLWLCFAENVSPFQGDLQELEG
ncbi:MAG TPA: hypothetical protein VFQ35_15910 [Polyangiaceae bacterium]|nr:hypothetical protein [Polyangiaceae bacterium]